MKTNLISLDISSDYNNSNLSPCELKKRIKEYRGHSIEFLRSLEEQYSSLENGNLNAIFRQSRKEIRKISKESLNTLQKIQEPLAKRNVKKISHLMKGLEKNIISVLQDTQIKTAIEITGIHQKKERKYLKTLIEGGISARFIKFFALFKTPNNHFRVAVKELHKTRIKMLDLSKSRAGLKDPEAPLTKVEEDQLAEFSQYQMDISDLAKRSGVIPILGSFRIKPTFSKKGLSKQLNSFIAQKISHQERIPLKKKITIEGNDFSNELIPLNAHFDQSLSLTAPGIFGSIFGTGGISSLNRQEPHLVNPYFSTLIKDNEPIFAIFRHGILTDKLETNAELRAANTEKVTEELITALLMKYLDDNQISLEDAANSQNPIPLSLTSVSLVTPDKLRTFFLPDSDERTMLKDQLRAFKKVSKQGKTLSVGGYQIPIDLSTNCFNFGVNAGAVGELKGLPGIKLGLDIQYKQNKKAWKSLKSELESLMGKIEVSDKDQQTLESLKRDIEYLLRNKSAYIKSGNQYEIGAKILNLAQIMGDLAKPYLNLKGFFAALNCFSGKDRTGFMDCVAKTFAAMYRLNYEFPSHEALKNNSHLQEQFKTILLKFLKESGSLEITEINTGVSGYKVGREARIVSLPIDDFFKLQGLSFLSKH